MRTCLSLAAIAGVIGVITGALGAHALKATLMANETLSSWETAVLYNLIHAPAIMGACLYADGRRSDTRWLTRACICWLAGIALFSGSLYGLSLQGPRWLGPITPLGGLFLIAGWLCLLGQARKTPSTGEK